MDTHGKDGVTIITNPNEKRRLSHQTARPTTIVMLTLYVNVFVGYTGCQPEIGKYIANQPRKKIYC